LEYECRLDKSIKNISRISKEQPGKEAIKRKREIIFEGKNSEFYIKYLIEWKI